MSTMTLPQTNGSTAYHPSQNWLQFSVQKFFMGINWDDSPPAVQAAKIASSEPDNIGPLSLTMTVNQFFHALNWEGQEIAAAVPQEPSFSLPTQPPNEITLDDFSNLF